MKKFLIFCIFFEVFASLAAFSDEMNVVIYKREYALDAHVSSLSSEAELLSALNEGLISYDAQGLSPVFSLASSCKSSRDKKRWTFFIREGATFSDGSPIKAENVRRSWLALLKRKGAPYSSFLDIIEGAKEFREGKAGENAVEIRSVGDKEVHLLLKTPAPYLLNILCMPAFAVLSGKKGVYSGAFVLSEKSEDKIVIEKNKNYYDAENVKLERVTFFLSDDVEKNAYMFNMGEADWVASSVDTAKVLSKDFNVFSVSPQFGTDFLYFKVREGSFWSKKEARVALLEAIDWEKLREKSIFKAKTLIHPINGYGELEGYEYTDRNYAASLMKKLKGSGEVTLTLCVLEGTRRDLIEVFREACRALGVKLVIKEVDFERYINPADVEADLIPCTWIGDFNDPLAFLELFRSTSTINLGGYSNEKFDCILEESNFLSGESRMRTLERAENLLLDDYMIVPIEHPVSFNVIDLREIGGWYTNLFNFHPLKSIYRKSASKKGNGNSVIVRGDL